METDRQERQGLGPRHPVEETSGPPTRTSSRRGVAFSLAITAILVWSLVLRLGFGLRDVHGRAGHDERYNLENVAKVVSTGEWNPANGYYSQISWAPQAALAAGLSRLSAKSADEPLVLFVDGRPTRFTTYLFRALQALYGTLLVYVVYRLGCELSGAAAGLLAAALASSSWLYVWAGSWFKPDGLAALASALAVLWTVRAIRQPTLPHLLLAGVGVGLAASAKLTAVLAALPLALAVPFLARRALRRWRDLLLAAVASLASFLATAPHWKNNLHYVTGVLESYARRASSGQHTYLEFLGKTYGDLLNSLHGPLWTALFWLGALALAVPAATRTVSPARRLALRAAVALVLSSGPLLLIVARTPFLRPNNVFPVLPLATVVASATAVEIWRRASRWRSRLDRPAAAWGAAILVLASPLADGTYWLYSKAVPTTGDFALVSLRRKMTMYPGQASARIVFHERLPPPRVDWDGREWRGTAVSAYVEVESLAALDTSRLDRADAEVFLERRLHGDQEAFYTRRLRSASRVDFVRSRLLRTRGPDLVILVHPWREGSRQPLRPTAPDSAGTRRLRLPAALDNVQAISLVFSAPRRRAAPTELRLEGREIPLHPPSLTNRRWNVVAISERFTPHSGDLVELSRKPHGAPYLPSNGARAVEIVRWSADSDLLIAPNH